jgi:hypothetical protein
MAEQFDEPTESVAGTMPVGLGAVYLRWYRQSARTAIFRAPRWDGLQASPALVAVMAVTGVLLTLLLERGYIRGPANFYWQAVVNGWIGTAISAWICYLMRAQPGAISDTASGTQSTTTAAPSAMHLFCMMMVQSQITALAIGLAYIALIQSGHSASQALGTRGAWALWLLPLAWEIFAELLLLWRGGLRRRGPMLVASVSLLAAVALALIGRMEFWYPVRQPDAQAEQKQLDLTQEAMEAQPRLLAKRLQEIVPQRPGIIDLYAITFSPYASEDVFQHESDMVSQVMMQRFDARGRTLQLVNHVDTVEQWPWATPLNLQRAIRHFAKVMNPAEDILFLHLTSHGARNGELAAEFWPMDVAAITPAQLKTWLDDAHVKYRVISISACYSGSWIAPLAGDDTLVMTAADANHTSYGCGRGSALTYFGRAMYDEQLRSSTLSFEQAHAAAREIIKKRENEAGKSDGYSNPQIKEGEGIRKQLALLVQRLQQPDQR